MYSRIADDDFHFRLERKASKRASLLLYEPDVKSSAIKIKRGGNLSHTPSNQSVETLPLCQRFLVNEKPPGQSGEKRNQTQKPFPPFPGSVKSQPPLSHNPSRGLLLPSVATPDQSNPMAAVVLFWCCEEEKVSIVEKKEMKKPRSERKADERREKSAKRKPFLMPKTMPVSVEPPYRQTQ